MPRKENIRSLSIKNTIIFVFIVLTIVTVTLICFLVFSNWRSSAKNIISKIAEDMNSKIYHQIEAYMHTPLHVNEENHKLIENGIIDLTKDKEREKFFVGVLQSHRDEIYSFSYGAASGEYYGARRNEKGIIEIMKNNTDTGGHSWYYSLNEDLTAGELVMQAGIFDVRTRDWYKVAKDMGKPVFSPVYKHFIMPDLTISAAWPIYNNVGEFQGVLGTHIILSYINELLKGITSDIKGYSLIVQKDSGELIANSFDIPNFKILDEGKILRTKITEIENEVLAKAYNQYISTKNRSFKQKTTYDQLYMDFTEYTQTGVNWIIISAVPESLLLNSITDSIQATTILIIVSILTSYFIYFFIIKKLIKPIDSLIIASERIAEGDMLQRVPIVRNDELGRISKSFNKMADTILMLINNLEATVKDRTSELQKKNEDLIESKDHLRILLDSTAEGIYGIDKDGNCTFCNTSSLEMLGYNNQEELLGKNMHLQIHHSRRDGSSIPVEECEIYKALTVKHKAHVNNEIFWRADGTCFEVEYHSYPQYKENELIGAVVTFMDITERRKDEEQINYLHSHDSLTGLMNRRYFEERLKKCDIIDNLPISIIFADVNGLKLMNDIFGHASGDTLLKKAAEVLKRATGQDDLVARVGGDEFIILLPRTDASEAKKVIQKIKSMLPMEKVDAIKCDMALGFDTKTDTIQNIERIMGNAENEMYKEKTLNRKTVNTEMIDTIITTLFDISPREKNHSIAVGELCEKMGQVMKLSETKVKMLKEAGLLHDIGKVVLNDEIINKEGEFTEDEIQKIKQHSVVGYRILNLFDNTLDLAEGVYSHHEKWDGTGFPKGLMGEEIPIISRIISLAETYDKRMSEAKGNESMKKLDTINFIREKAGTYFDPTLTEIFIKMLEAE